MENTKQVTAAIIGLLLIVGWAVLNVLVWEYLLGDSMWGMVGVLSTFVVLPAYSVALYCDYKERF